MSPGKNHLNLSKFSLRVYSCVCSDKEKKSQWRSD